MDTAARARQLALAGIEVRATQSQNTGNTGGQTAHEPAGSPKGGQFTSSPHGSGIGSMPAPAYKSGGGAKKAATAAPANTPQAPTEPRTMKVGDSGEDVRYAQYAMNLLGFKVTQDGNYGPETEAAVKQIQERLGVKKPNGHLSSAQLHKLQDAVRLSPCIGGGQRDLAFEAQWEARDVEDVDDALDEDTEALIEALGEFVGADERSFNEALHPRNPKGSAGGGRFRSIVDRVVDALSEWKKGNGPDDPLKDFDRAQLLKAAKAHGHTFRRGASLEEIKAQILDDVRNGAKAEHASKPNLPGAPADHRRFTIQHVGAATDVGIFGNPTTGKLSLYRESDTGKRSGRAIKSFDDMASLESWARDNGHTELADYAKAEQARTGGVPAAEPLRIGGMVPAGEPIPDDVADLPTVPKSRIQGGDFAVWSVPGELPIHGRVVDLGPRRKFIDWEGGRREPLRAGMLSNVTFHREGGPSTGGAAKVAKPAPGKAESAKVAEIASAFHEDWRKTRLGEDGKYGPRVKTTKDEAWIKAHGTDQVDIANTSYNDLPDDWKAENKAAAEVIAGILEKHGGKVDLNDEKTRLAVGEEIHQAWLSRNSWAKGGELDVPFADLPRSEQDKDTDQLKVAMSATAASSPATKAAKAAPAKGGPDPAVVDKLRQHFKPGDQVMLGHHRWEKSVRNRYVEIKHKDGSVTPLASQLTQAQSLKLARQLDEVAKGLHGESSPKAPEASNPLAGLEGLTAVQKRAALRKRGLSKAEIDALAPLEKAKKAATTPAKPTPAAADSPHVASLKSRLAAIAAEAKPITDEMLKRQESAAKTYSHKENTDLYQSIERLKALREEGSRAARELLDALAQRDGEPWGGDPTTDATHWEAIRPAGSFIDRGTVDPATWQKLRDVYMDDQKTLEHNASLRTGNPTPAAKAWASKASQMVNSSELTHDTKLARGAALPPETVMQLRPGAVIHDRGIVSTAETGGKFDEAKIYMRDRLENNPGTIPTMFEIRAPKGTPAANVGYGEVVLDRDGRFRIVSSRMGDDGVVHVVMELIGK